MASFQKPENALNAADRLIDVGKKQDALDTLQQAIHHKKWRNMWSATIEQIVIRHLELCVELKKTRNARDGLHAYRTTCQSSNIHSLELVVQKFRKGAEDKVNEAKKQQDDLRMSELENLDEMEAPQTILLRAIQASDTRQQSQDRDVHMHFRFLWDSYKVILDVLKSNARLEDVYNETARHAFEFCHQNKRPQEFKRLCDTLRKNYQDLFKRTGVVPAHQVNPNNEGTVTRTLETRIKQLQIAMELDLWRESYNTATEIYELMNKAKTKPNLRSRYYEYLGRIFWKSDNYLFHAFACLKNLLLVKTLNKNLSKEELQLLASRAVLATLCVPFQKNSDMRGTLDLTMDSASSQHEKARRHATLFNAQLVPTRDAIIAQLGEKNLLSLALKPCQKLFALIESDFTPLSLCQDAKPFLDEIASDVSSQGKLLEYVVPLKKIIFFRLMKQLSEVYANMTIENFERAASIVPFSLAEKWMANAAKDQGINIQINYSQEAIVFGAPRKVDMKSMRQPLIEIGHKLQQALQRVAPEEQLKKDKVEKQMLSNNIVRRIEEETRQIRQRKEEIERRKEEQERRKELQEREAVEKQKKQDAKEREAERIRLEEQKRLREQDRDRQRRKEAELAKNKEVLEEMKKNAEKQSLKVKVGGKNISEIAASDLEEITFDQIKKAQEAQVTRERQEKIRQRKMENKRVDHLARALREEERDKLDNWVSDIQEQDREFIRQAEDRLAEEQRRKHEAGLEERSALLPFQKAKDKWVAHQLESREAEYAALVRAQQARLKEQVADNKIKRARERKSKEDALHAERERTKREEMERERARREQEERAAEEERAAAERRALAEKQRQEEEEKRERMDARRREAEKRIEEKQQREVEESRGNKGGRGGREADEGKRRGGRGDESDEDFDTRRTTRRNDDEESSWRRPAAESRQSVQRDDEDTWRRPAAGARGGARDDDDDGDNWRKPAAGNRAAPARQDAGSAWGRGNRGAREEESWRKPAADEDDRRGDDRRGDDRRGDDRRGGAWRRSVVDDDDKDSWRKPTTVARGAAAARDDDDGDNWRRGGNAKAGGARQEEGTSAWGRGGGNRAGGGRDEEGGAWRRPTVDDDDRRGGGGTRNRAPGDDEKTPWKTTSKPSRNRGDDSDNEVGVGRGGRVADSVPVASPQSDDDNWQTQKQSTKKSKEVSAEPKQVAAPAEDAEDEGWSSVSTKKKKKDKAPAGGADEEEPSSAWGKGGARGTGKDASRGAWGKGGDQDDGRSQAAKSRNDWKNKGQEDAGRGGGAGAWRRPGGGGADSGSWR